MTDKVKQRDKYLYKYYGISQRQFLMMLDAQKDCCATCLQHFGVKRINVDHEHIKGFKKFPPELKAIYVRGLCCYKCNRFLLGAADKYKNCQVDVLIRTVIYLSEYGQKRNQRLIDPAIIAILDTMAAEKAKKKPRKKKVK